MFVYYIPTYLNILLDTSVFWFKKYKCTSNVNRKPNSKHILDILNLLEFEKFINFTLHGVPK